MAEKKKSKKEKPEPSAANAPGDASKRPTLAGRLRSKLKKILKPKKLTAFPFPRLTHLKSISYSR